jgi:hypothetical protein
LHKCYQQAGSGRILIQIPLGVKVLRPWGPEAACNPVNTAVERYLRRCDEFIAGTGIFCFCEQNNF